jgi:hypothetical protein
MSLTSLRKINVNLEGRNLVENHIHSGFYRSRDAVQESVRVPDARVLQGDPLREHLGNAALRPALRRPVHSTPPPTQGFDLLVHHLLDGPCEKYYITEQRYLSPESRKKRSYTLVKWGYSIVYYLISSVWAYKIIRETSFMPTWLGGNGNPLNMTDNAPHIPDVTF